jgi:hypothetical protein
VKHRCPVNGCEAQLPREILMCAPHWRMVPRDLQNAVNAAWRASSAEAYLKARAAAVSAVNQKLKGAM